jgi:glucose/mannose-6-phosphate isomerase
LENKFSETNQRINKIKQMMDQAIKDFAKQFDYNPMVENSEKLAPAQKYLVCAMGGSALSSSLLKLCHPEIDLILHRDYGLPTLPAGHLDSRLVLLISYSGNTEEVIDAYVKAKFRGLPLAVVTKGGRLLELAKADKIPYVQIPDTGIQPRNALGFILKAQLKLIGASSIFNVTSSLRAELESGQHESEGRALATRLKNKVPIIYSSVDNEALARICKIKLNETGKVPSYYNVIPELNHNEMQSFYVLDVTRALSNNFYFLFLHDNNDHPRIQKRMEVTKLLYEEKGLKVETIDINGGNQWLKIFNTICVIDWASYYLATGYGADPEKVEMVEDFKKRIA